MFHLDFHRTLISAGIVVATILTFAGHDAMAAILSLAINHIWLWGD